MKAVIALAPLLLSATAAPTQSVLWDFYETGCTSMSPDPCAQPVGNPAIVSLILPGATSSGSASWNGNPNDPAVLTGDADFQLSAQGIPPIGAPNYGTSAHFCGLGGPTCNYSLSWNEVDDQLLALSFNYDGLSVQANLGLTGGTVATDSSLGPCVFSQCEIAGFWADPPGAPLVNAPAAAEVPEPTTLGLLSLGLLVAWRKRAHGQFPPPT